MAEETKVVIVREEPVLLFRDLTVERGETAVRADGGISLAFSSEAPVLRVDWYTGQRYQEVLAHDAGNIDESYMRDGLPFLLEHDGPQVGILRDLKLGADKKLRGVAYPGNHPEAGWVFKDMADGIRTKVSVGYRAGDQYDEVKGKGDAPATRRYTRWTPMEVSSVAIPADIGVGVGRSAGDGGATAEVPAVKESRERVEEVRMSEKETPEPGTIKVADARIAQIDSIAIASGATAAQRSEWIASDKSPETIGREVAAQREKIEREIAERSKSTVDLLGISKKDQRAFSLINAVRSVTETGAPSGFEKEVSDALAKRYGEAPGMGFKMPMDMGHRVTGQLDTGTTSQGAELKFIEPGSFIELLRNRSYVERLGARVLSGLQGNVAFPRQTAAQSGSWVGEGPTTAVSLSAATLDQVSMSPKTYQAATSISRQLLIQGVIGAEEFARADIAQVHALARDLAAIAGTGANSQPTGLLTLTTPGSVTMGAAGAVITYAKYVEMEKVVAQANADQGALAYLTTPGVRSNSKTTQRFTSTDTPLWTGPAAGGEVNGYPAWATNQVPSNLTKGTSTTVCHAVIFGNWNEMILGQWGAFDIIVDPYTLATKNLIQLVSFQTFDVVVRHGASFAYIKDVLVT